nr:hypothetical protein [Tanacetum cinerariifolium]
MYILMPIKDREQEFRSSIKLFKTLSLDESRSLEYNIFSDVEENSEEIKKVNEKVYAAQVGCEQCKGPHYTKDCPLKKEGASVSVMPFLTYLNLGLGELAHTKLTVEFVDRTVKYRKGIAENVLVRISLRERMELDLEARLMGETLVLNRSLDALYGDYIELNDLNVPLEFRRGQVNDLMPTIEEGKMAARIKTREMSFLENHSAKLNAWKQEGLTGLSLSTMVLIT